MVRNIVILLLFGFASIFAQDENSPIFIEHNTIVAETDQTEIISYRIPYKNLLFVKNGDNYTSSFTLTFEFYKNDIFVFREILNPRLNIQSYEESLSDKKFFQNYVKLNITPGNYKLKTFLGLGSTEIQYKIPDQNIIVDSLTSKILQEPIIVSSELLDDKNHFLLANYGNQIPFSSQKYNMIFGVAESFSDSASVSILQNKKSVFTKKIKSSFNGGIKIQKKDSDLVVSINDSASINFFMISNFSHLLYEGSAELIISIGTFERKFTLNTRWINKPKVLSNHEYSIKLLSYIEKDIIVSDLLSLNEDNYYTALTEYWVEKYPANGMKFNFAMQEYYNRADYAIKNFSSLNSFDGAERDRGKIYILYGEPASKERNYTEMNEIVEVWNYINAGRTFVFKDTNGTGKFDIVK